MEKLEHPPKIKIRTSLIKENVRKILNRFNIETVGITKGVCADLKIAKAMIESGINILGDARIRNLIKYKRNFVVDLMMIRIPMKSETDKVIKYTDYSLNSEISIMKELSKEAEKQNKTHKTIIMIDLGDRREGIMPENLIPFLQKTIDLPNLEIKGIGTNLGSFSGVLPTQKNTQKLVELKNKTEKELKTKLPIISGGSTINLKLLEENKLPEQINQLRIGEGILLGTAGTQNRKIPYLNQNTIEIEAEIIEHNKKPSKPKGKTGKDAFGKKQKFKDKGKIERAIVAIGKQDTSPNNLKPKDPKIQILGASSDHTILDITKTNKNYKIGDKITFKPSYSDMLRAFTSPYIRKEYH